MFDHEEHGHLDVFVGEFVMCHRLELEGRLDIHPETISLGDLLLTKLQVAELTAKDVSDVSALLSSTELAADESGLNVRYVSGLLAEDWGWWRTVTENFARVRSHLPAVGLPEPATSLAIERLESWPMPSMPPPRNDGGATERASGSVCRGEKSPRSPGPNCTPHDATRALYRCAHGWGWGSGAITRTAANRRPGRLDAHEEPMTLLPDREFDRWLSRILRLDEAHVGNPAQGPQLRH